MKQYYFSLFLFALCLSCGSGKKEQAENSISADDNETIEISDSEQQIDNERLVAWKAFADECAYLSSDSLTYYIKPTTDYEEFDKKKIVLAELSEQEFKNLGLTPYQLHQLLEHETDSSFTVAIKGEKCLFNKEPSTTIVDYGDGRGGLTWSEYIAYYPQYGLHAVRSVAVSGDLHGFADIYLVSDKTAQLYNIPTGGDANSGTPIPSPNGEYLINIDTSYDYTIGYVHYVQVIKMKEGEQGELKPLYLIESDAHERALRDPIWMDEKTFIVKGEKEEWIDGENIVLSQYFIGKIPENI